MDRLNQGTEAAKVLGALFAVFDEAMTSEQVPPSTRRRVINQLMFGNPDGDSCAKASLEVEAGVAAMDPEKLRRFREGDWVMSAEEAGFGPVPEKVEIPLIGSAAALTS